MSKKPILGGHVSMNKPQGYLLGAAQTAFDQGANTFMIFSGPPQNSKRIDTALLKINEMQTFVHNQGWKLEHLVVHAPYILNIANPVNLETWEFSVDFLQTEIKRCEAMGINLLVLHPGAYTKEGTLPQALDQVVKALDRVLAFASPVKIALETMSGKGTEICAQLEDFVYILEHVKNPSRVGLCLDTCHLNDAGYDLHQWSSFKEKLGNLIGYEKVLVIHLNDSLNPLNSHKDRHANIGYGTLGFDTLYHILQDETFMHIPKILETPLYQNQSTHKDEIQDLLSGKFSDFLKKRF